MKFNNDEIKVRVAQMGWRQRYEVPSIIHLQTLLELFCTDIWLPYGDYLYKISQLIKSKSLESLSYNYNSYLPKSKVRGFNLLGIRARWAYRLAKRISDYELYREYIRYGQEFSNAINRLPQAHNVFLGFSSTCLESLEMESRRGNLTLVDQIDPARIEAQLVAEERKRWPGWDIHEDAIPEEYFQRLGAEWRLADLVIVNSEFSKNCLIAQKVNHTKIKVIPLAYPIGPENIKFRNLAKQFQSDSMLKIIFIF